MRGEQTSFGTLLKRYRTAAGLTQEALAARAQLSARTIADLERGINRLPRHETFELLGSALNLTAPQRALFLALMRPDMTAASPTSQSRLPLPPTALVGRTEALARAVTLLRSDGVRLLTLTGTGGVGKTRLALEVAAKVTADFADGTCFVALAPISEPGLVVSTIAQALGVREQGSRPLLDGLKDSLREQQLLLLLDNFEQVVDTAPQLVDLLQACPHLKLLVTSRAVLHVSGEHEFPVLPLAVPDLRQLPAREDLAHVAAVALFLQRARMRMPGFQLTEANQQAVAELCVRLDGVPLALELAAARIKLFPPAELLARLDQRWTLLTSQARDVPRRHQTMRNTIDWSYQLLAPQDQRLFRRLSVFVGGCTLPAVEAVCAVLDGEDGASQIADGVAALLDQSLLQTSERAGEAPRLVLLETLREYALEQLATQGERRAAQRAHAAYYVHLAEEAEIGLEGNEQVRWLARLEREHDNLRAALRWGLEAVDDEDGKQHREFALRLGGALRQFWYLHAHLQEGQTFLARALVASADAAHPARAKALLAAASLTLVGGEPQRAATLAEEGLALFRQVGDPVGTAFGLFLLGVSATYRGEHAQARTWLEESAALLRGRGATYHLGRSLMALGLLHFAQGDMDWAGTRWEEALALFRKLGNTEAMASLLFQLGLLRFYTQGDALTAYALFEEACTLLRAVGQTGEVAVSLIRLAEVALLGQGNSALACSLAEEALALFQELEYQGGMAEALFVLARLEARQGNYSVARRLYEELLPLARAPDDRRQLRLPIPYRLHLRGSIPKVFDDTLNLPFYLEGLAEVVAAQGTPVWAARLWGAAAALREALPSPRPTTFQVAYEQAVAAARRQVGQQVFAANWEEGRTVPLELVLVPPGQAVLPDTDAREAPVPSTRTPATAPAGLSPREVEVLCLVAEGLTNEQIAERLVISYRTVTTHLNAIYIKLEVTSRAAATRFAVEHHLV